MPWATGPSRAGRASRPQLLLTTRPRSPCTDRRVPASFLAAIGCTADDLECLYAQDWESIIVAQDAARRFIPIDEPVSAFMQILPSGTLPGRGRACQRGTRRRD